MHPQKSRRPEAERFTEWFGTIGATLLFLIAVIPILNPMFFFPGTWIATEASVKRNGIHPFEVIGWALIAAVGLFSYRTDFFSRRSIMVPGVLCAICSIFYFVGQLGFTWIALLEAIALTAYLVLPWFGGIGIAALLFNRPHRRRDEHSES